MYHIDRYDPLMIQICSELGENINGEYSKIAIELTPAQFANYY